MVNKNVKKYNEEINVREGIILVGVLTIVVLVIYLLTLGAQKIGLFDEGYTKPEISAAVISYDTIMAGSLFNKTENEYYVLAADFSDNQNLHLSSIGASYSKKENHLPIYSLDLNNHFNKGIVGDTSNPSAQTVKEIKISEPTLIYIKNGKNYRYIVGIDNIKNELGL